MIVCETPRLLLRHLDIADAPFILRLLNEPTFLQFIGDRGVRSVEDAERYLTNGPLESYRKNGFGLFLTTLKDDTPIGICGLLKRETLEDVDVGFAFVPEYWGKGYGFEAASEVLRYGFETIGLRRIVAITQTDNLASIKTLERLGLVFVRMVRMAPDDAELMLFAKDR